MNVIEQNQTGNIIAICYQDNGTFYMCILDLAKKSEKRVKISDILHIDNKSKPLSGFWEPLITCAFIPSDQNDQVYNNFYINVYHRIQMKHYHF
jgi:hypothetical protein